MNKKANAGFFIFGLIIILIIGYYVTIESRDCNSNTDCEEGFYCGSDYACHQIPVIEKIVKSHDFTIAAIILSVGAIITAIILKRRPLP
jgi:hypothetical protein